MKEEVKRMASYLQKKNWLMRYRECGQMWRICSWNINSCRHC